MNSKSLLVTGGAGYIGTTLIRDALELGYNVTCLDLLVYGGKPLSTFFNHPRFKFIQGDIRDKKILNSILKDIDLVVNLAAIVGDKPCQAAPDSAVSINSLGAKILADCCIKNSIEKYIFASTCSNYGISDPKLAVTEEGDLNPVSLYAETKIDTENYLNSLNNNKMKTICLRFGTAFGISARTRFDLAVNSLTFEAFINNQITVFAGNTWRPYIHVKDISGIIINFLNAPSSKIQYKIYNAGFNSQNFTKNQIVDFLLMELPNLKVNNINTVDDRRTYKVSFSRLEKLFPNYNIKSVREGMAELLLAFNTGVLKKNDFESNNLNRITDFFKQNENKLRNIND